MAIDMRIGRSIDKTSMSVQDWTAVAQNEIVKSAEVSLSNIYRSLLHIQAALDTETAHTGTRFRAQISASESGDEDWQDWADFVALIGTAATDAIEDDPLAAGSTAIALTGHGLTTEGILLFIEDGTLANSEIGMEASQSTDEVVLLDETTNEHAASTAIFNIAMVQNIALPASAVRARVVVDNSYDPSGSSLYYKVRVSNVTGV